MDICHNASLSTLDDLFPPHNMEVDFGMEWLSVFVEECFSSQSFSSPQIQTTNTNKNPSNTIQKPQQQQNQYYLHNFVVPRKPRSKRKRLSSPRKIWSHSYPPLLKQTYWLVKSELVSPNLKIESEVSTVTCRDTSVYRKDKKNQNDDDDEKEDDGNARRCSHCLSQKTPQWRAGPLGPKTLCNACGVRYKSGRLLPEYRPAKSPTFVSYLHSNSHKKVLKMRMQSN
ncbi:GATA transcription factor 9-like [Vicia villosa]|uniref:GATA transcription factor 9-like n=1 Tax=Vicia villosa TaxID=3911 RepID=UPI00273AC792|nr:GATA transcription factor 9-like [Vicia villosa]